MYISQEVCKTKPTSGIRVISILKARCHICLYAYTGVMIVHKNNKLKLKNLRSLT